MRKTKSELLRSAALIAAATFGAGLHLASAGDPTFGITFTVLDDEARPIIFGDLSTIGIIGPMPNAKLTDFPLNTPVHVNSNQLSKLAKIGVGGYVGDAIRAINDQLDDMQFAGRLVLVNTAEGTNVDANVKLQETITNIIGSSTAGTGIWSFMKSADLLGFTPRLLLAPGYTSQMANSVDGVTVDDPGAGYNPGDVLPITFSGGGTNAVQATGTVTVAEDGTVDPDSVVLTTLGAWYTTTPTATVDAPPAGEGATQATLAVAGVSAGANPVCAALPGVLGKLLGHAVVESAGSSEQNDFDWRETINSKRLIPISGGCRVLDPDSGDIVIRPLAPRIVGVGIKRDHQAGVFSSWANQPIYGILGPTRDIPFALTDDANEGQEELNANIGILVRGELGNDFAIASSGFIFIGTDNAGDDELWRFYNVTRGRDYIHLMLLRSLRVFLGRYNIIGHTVQAVCNTMEDGLMQLYSKNWILGYEVNFAVGSNSADAIRSGKLTVGFKAEEPAPLRLLNIESSRMRSAVDTMIADLAAQLNFTSIA